MKITAVSASATNRNSSAASNWWPAPLESPPRAGDLHHSSHRPELETCTTRVTAPSWRPAPVESPPRAGDLHHSSRRPELVTCTTRVAAGDGGARWSPVSGPLHSRFGAACSSVVFVWSSVTSRNITYFTMSFGEKIVYKLACVCVEMMTLESWYTPRHLKSATSYTRRPQ